MSIELSRYNKKGLCVGLHPGTVDSNLSKPFQKNIAPEKLFSPTQSVTQLIETLSKLKPEDTGFQFAYDGEKIPA